MQGRRLPQTLRSWQSWGEPEAAPPHWRARGWHRDHYRQGAKSLAAALRSALIAESCASLQSTTGVVMYAPNRLV